MNPGKRSEESMQEKRGIKSREVRTWGVGREDLRRNNKENNMREEMKYG